MADTAFQTQYREEFVAQFEQKVSYFRAAGTNDVVIQGQTAVFLVAGTGGRQAVTRGVNGMIPSSSDSLAQTSIALQEWHDKPRRTKFNIFASQGNGRQILQAGTVKVLNRKVDDLMISALNTGTLTTGAVGVPANLALFSKAQGILGNSDVDVDEEDNMFCSITPAARNYLNQIKEFASADYVDVKTLDGAFVKMKRWMGLNWFVSNRLPGRTTSTETCFMFHRSALGWAINSGDMEVDADYNREESYYWARASAFMGAGLLQNVGVVKITHDGSAINAG